MPGGCQGETGEEYLGPKKGDRKKAALRKDLKEPVSKGGAKVALP